MWNVVSIFFDLKKAYDTIQNYSIMKDIYTYKNRMVMQGINSYQLGRKLFMMYSMMLIRFELFILVAVCIYVSLSYFQETAE